MAPGYTTVTDPAARAAALGAVSGGWKYRTYADPVPPQSLAVSPAHLRGSFPPGKAPIKARPGNVPIVVVDSADEWAGWGSGQIGGWQRLGDTPTDDNPGYHDDAPVPPGVATRGSPAAKSPAMPPARTLTTMGYGSHDAYQVSSGVGMGTALTQGNTWRSEDLGAVAGRARGPSDARDVNATSATAWPMAWHNPSIGVQRGSNGLPLNNPGGIPGHRTPRIQRWQNAEIRFGPALRTHHAHTLRQRTPWAHTTTVISPRDPYGSPYDAGDIVVTTGTTVPERMTSPGMWDQVALDVPSGAGTPSEDDQGYYGGFYGGDWST